MDKNIKTEKNNTKLKKAIKYNQEIKSWQDLVKIYKIKGYSTASKLINEMTANPLVTNSIKNLQDLTCFIANKNDGLGIENYNKKKELTLIAIKQNPKLEIKDIDELMALIKNLNIKDCNDRRSMFIDMMKANPFIIKDISSIKKMVNFFTNNREEDIDFIITNIVNESSLINNIQDFFTIIDNLQIVNYENHNEIIKKIILNNIHILENANLIPILLNCLFINNQDSQELTKEIILKHPQIIENVTTLSNLIKEIEIENEVAKKDFAIFAINQNSQIITNSNNQKEDIKENLKNLIKLIKIEYRVDLICDLIKELTFFKNQFTDKNQQNTDLIKIINTLYNNDFYRIELLKQAIEENLINQSNFLDSGFERLEEEEFLNIVLYAKNKNLISNIELFNYFDNKSFGRHQSIKESLINKKIKDILLLEGVTNILEELYENENYQENDALKFLDKPAISIITYCDIFNKTEILATAIKQEVKEELKQKFYPSGFEILNQEQISKIANLIEKDPQQLKSQYINIGELSKIFVQYFSKIPNFKQSIANTKFQKLIEQAIQNNDQFQDLLLFIYPDQKEIIDNNTGKINDSIKGNKDNFFYILSQKDGTEMIKNIIIGVNDGCKANIANQINNQALKIAIDNSDIEDKKHKYSLIKTYNIFMERIIIPIINNGEDQLGGSSSANFLQDKQEELRESYIALSALYKYGEQNTAYQIEIIGNEFAEKIANSNYCDQISEISSFIALKSILGEEIFSKIIKNYRVLDKSKIINKINSTIIGLDGDNQDYIEPENDNNPCNQMIPKNKEMSFRRLNNRRIFD